MEEEKKKQVANFDIYSSNEFLENCSRIKKLIYVFVVIRYSSCLFLLEHVYVCIYVFFMNLLVTHCFPSNLLQRKMKEIWQHLPTEN